MSSSSVIKNQNKHYADLVLRNGWIYTVDRSNPWAQSLGILGESIAFIGNNDQTSAWIGPKTEVIDLDGKMVLPGFIDSHTHVSGAVFMVAQADLHGLKSLEAYKDAIAHFAQEHTDLKVVYGNGWADGLFPPTGPRKEDLDTVVPDRPAAVGSYDGHSIWVNTLALSVAGITNDTLNPSGGVIERDPNTGEPSGTLRETAMDLIHCALPPFTVEQITAGIIEYQKLAAEWGITSAHDPMLNFPGAVGSYLGSGLSKNNVVAFSELAKGEQLTVHIRGSFLVTPDGGLGQGID